METLVNELINYIKAYDEGHPIISDKEYDKLYFELVELEKKEGYALPNSPTQKIGYEVVSTLKKVEHEYPLLSLDKTKDWNEFIHYFNDKDVIGMVKLDGLTCALTYENGVLVRAETRGDGKIGEDVTHNARVIKSIPQRINYTDRIVINGEIICTYKDFEPFKEQYANPRNFAAGSIRLLDSGICSKRNLTFIAWQIASQKTGNFIDDLNLLQYLGFKVVPWTSSFDLDAKEFLLNRAAEENFPIDGLVGRFDDITYGESLGITGHHSKAAFAFKMYDEEYDTTLLDIEWSLGRTSQLTPIAVFEPVDDGVSIIQRASLHNISIMQETFHGILGWVGQKIRVAKMNQIIPQLTYTEEWTKEKEFDCNYIEYPTVCPVCGAPVEVVESSSGVKNLVCNNPKCQGQLINQLDHFVGKKGLDIRGLSKATLEKLLDWGWVNCAEDIFLLSKFEKEWAEKPGFGAKSVKNILTAIENSKHTTLPKFIAALGIPLIGERMANELIKHFTTYEELREAVNNNFDFTALPNFADSKHEALINFDFNEADKIYKNYLTIDPVVAEDNSETALTDLTIVITGKITHFKNRDELANIIRQKGGKIGSSITSKTNILINNDINSTSAKNKRAKELHIPIISEDDFISAYLN